MCGMQILHCLPDRDGPRRNPYKDQSSVLLCRFIDRSWRYTLRGPVRGQIHLHRTKHRTQSLTPLSLYHTEGQHRVLLKGASF
ncbi:hypothetical protein B0H19DRAFT_1100254 [Mycena capillaripes]|nr:hypothetical protein B0H19DRAFT_1100254 [Mycena capillaripes]